MPSAHLSIKDLMLTILTLQHCKHKQWLWDTLHNCHTHISTSQWRGKAQHCDYRARSTGSEVIGHAGLFYSTEEEKGPLHPAEITCWNSNRDRDIKIHACKRHNANNVENNKYTVRCISFGHVYSFCADLQLLFKRFNKIMALRVKEWQAEFFFKFLWNLIK